MNSDSIFKFTDLCKKTSLPCPAGEKFRDAVTCREYYECGHNGQFLTKRLCPPTKEFDPRRGYCVLSTTFKCPPPTRCPNLSWNEDYLSRVSWFDYFTAESVKPKNFLNNFEDVNLMQRLNTVFYSAYNIVRKQSRFFLMVINNGKKNLFSLF